MKKRIIVIAVVLLTGAALGSLSLRLYRGGPVAVLGRAVVLDPGLAGQPNAADFYERATELAKTITAGEADSIDAALLRPIWADADGASAELLRREAPLENLVRRASVLPRFEEGASLGLIFARTPSPAAAGGVYGAYLLLLDGRRLLAAGRAAEALDDALAALAVARQFRREKNFALDGQMMSANIMPVAFPLVSDLIVSGLDKPRLELLRDALEPLADASDVGRGIRQRLEDAADSDEKLLQAWYVPPWISRKLIEDSARARREFAAAVEAGIGRNSAGAWGAEVSRRRIYGERPDSEANFAFCLEIGVRDPRAYGDCVIAYPTRTPELDYAGITRYLHAGCGDASVLLAAAGIRIYEWTRGRPPVLLQELVPEALMRVPVDDFDGFLPLRFISGPKSWTVYGFGPERAGPPGVRDTQDAPPRPGDVFVTAPRLR
jgi:hypothetical protein